MKILVAVDGADCSMRAVEFISERPWNGDDQFLVVSVQEPIPQEFGIGYVPPPSGALEQSMYDDCAKASGDAAASIKKSLPLNTVEVQVATGFVAETLSKLAASWEADLIILGSHGRKGISHLLLGSVAEAVLKNSPCSVEVIKPKTRQREGVLPVGRRTKKSKSE